MYLPEKKKAFYEFVTGKPKVNYKNLERHRAKIKRVEKAKRLLEEGLRVKEAAKKIGYAHDTRFCNAFKEVTGCTPESIKELLKREKELERVECWFSR